MTEFLPSVIAAQWFAIVIGVWHYRGRIEDKVEWGRFWYRMYLKSSEQSAARMRFMRELADDVEDLNTDPSN